MKLSLPNLPKKIIAEALSQPVVVDTPKPTPVTVVVAPAPAPRRRITFIMRGRPQ